MAKTLLCIHIILLVCCSYESHIKEGSDVGKKHQIEDASIVIVSGDQPTVKKKSEGDASLDSSFLDVLEFDSADGSSMVITDTSVDEFCSTILIQNSSLPSDYPPRYYEPENAKETFNELIDSFLANYGSSRDSYNIESHSITWTPHVWESIDVEVIHPIYLWNEVGPITEPEEGPSVTKNDGPIFMDLCKSTIQKWSDFLVFGHYELLENMRSDGPPICNDRDCTYQFKQNYCGLTLLNEHSMDDSYEGTITIRVDWYINRVENIDSKAIPIIPVYINPMVDKETLKQSLLGVEVSYPGSVITSVRTITDEWIFEFDDELYILVQKPHEDSDYLEYRTIYRLVVSYESDSPWVFYVDAIDGTLISNRPGFIWM